MEQSRPSRGPPPSKQAPCAPSNNLKKPESELDLGLFFECQSEVWGIIHPSMIHYFVDGDGALVTFSNLRNLLHPMDG